MALRLLLATGWLLQAAGFAAALVRQGRRAAEPREWPREAAIRVAMAALVVWALAGAPDASVPLPRAAAALLGAVFGAGQLLATWARAALGASWGVGVVPRGPAVRAGPYGLVAHPIYVGNLAAVTAQALLLQSAPAVALAAGALVVVPLKIVREGRALRGRAGR